MDPAVPISTHIAGMSYDRLPPQAVAAAKTALLDSFACALAGSTAPGIGEITGQLREWGGAPRSTVWAFGDRLPPPAAALANGVMTHAREFDDTHDIASVHACASTIPAAMALAEDVGGVSGKDFLTAVAVGVDISCRVGLSMERYKGWHMSGICGIFGATAAASSILRLDAETAHMALGIALSQASGTLQTVLDGALTKRAHPGFAAQAAVLSASLARRGVTGAREVFSGRYGFHRLYGGTKGEKTDPSELRRTDSGFEYRNAALLEELGVRFEGANLGYKPYPSCRATHGVLDGFLPLVRREGLGPENVREVRARVSPWVANLVNRPFAPGENALVAAQFSLQYLLAAGLLRGDVFLDSFTPEAVSDPRIVDILPKIKVIVDESIRHKVPVKVEVDLTDGRTLEETVYKVKGSLENPFLPEETHEKLRKSARFAARPVDEERVEKIISLVEDLERVDDVAELAAVLGEGALSRA